MEFILWSYININTHTESQLQIRDLALVIINNSVILLVLVFCYERNGKPHKVNEYNTIYNKIFSPFTCLKISMERKSRRLLETCSSRDMCVVCSGKQEPLHQ